jgi:hypothetical protein
MRLARNCFVLITCRYRGRSLPFNVDCTALYDRWFPLAGNKSGLNKALLIPERRKTGFVGKGGATCWRGDATGSGG